MNKKELKRLSRAELLDLLLQQTKYTELLEEKLRRTEELLTERYLKIQESGNLAHAVLQLNGVMEAAQAAAQQYLDNIVKMEERAKAQCEQLLAQAREEASRIRAGAAAPESEETDSTDC